MRYFLQHVVNVVNLKPVSIQVQFVSYQCQQRHKLLIEQCQISEHQSQLLCFNREQFQQGHIAQISVIYQTCMTSKGTLL